MLSSHDRSATSRRRRSRLPALAAVPVLALPALAMAPIGPASAAETAPAALTVRPDPSYQQPAFEGWGTALAWFANVTGGWPDAQRNALADALYGADGLGFTIARYNIGGGDSPETAPYMRPGGAVPGYWNRPGAETPGWWDPNDPTHWNDQADANQRWWLTAAKARGATTFEAFSNSAPYFMTNSGLVSGSADGSSDNLRSDQYDRFAAYLSGSLRRAEQGSGVSFTSVSPVNEPSASYWKAGGRQEGSHWDPASVARIVSTLRTTLDAAGKTTEVSAMDDFGPDVAAWQWSQYSPAARDAVGRINVHTYSTGGRSAVRDIAKGEGTPLWMSENDLGGSIGQSFTDMRPGLDLAAKITTDIRQLEPSAWVLWQAVEDYENMTPERENSNWGLIQTDFTPADAATEPLRKNKKYWTMAQYSRFIRPGARVVPTDDPDTLAAVRPNGQGLVLVHTNHGSTARDVTLDLGGFRTTGGAVERYTTDATRNVERGTDLAVTGKTLRATVAPGSVTTFVLPGVTGVNAGATGTPAGAARQILNDNSGKALAVTTVAGKDTLVQRTPNAADPAQQWTFTKTSATDWSSTAGYHVTSAKTGKALSVTAGALGFATPGAGAEQQWMRSTAGDGHTTLVNSATGQLLDVSGEPTADGAPVGVYRPTAGANQSWTFRPTAADVWQAPAFQHSGKCLDVAGVSTADGAEVFQYGCNGGTNQQWSLRPASTGYVNIVARHSGKCLDVSGGSTADGAQVLQYGCNGGRNQEWAAHTVDASRITLMARHSGKCLDIEGGTTADGVAVRQYACNGGTNQQLRLG
ncbi:MULTISPECIES: RICIN domain-containing protein [Streptomyces]|uniref:RICIN domain-containing protein n=1 Tax=Streptomyces TaxID=1883 RepID=UPI000689E495|nr:MULTISPECIES: RICIN domain-containing protein [Streptomyces]